MTRALAAMALMAAWCGTAASSATAQMPRDTVVIPNAAYAAGDLREWAFGDDYRDLWATPIRVPFLDLDRYAGGLTPVRLGGGRQTASLRLRGADGRVYTFRSVDKRPGGAYEPALRETVIGRAIQDQTSALHPAAALMVPPLLDAVGAAYVTPTLYVMPDDPRLGEFRAQFAGMLGLVEERPNELPDGEEGFRDFSRVIGTSRLLERLEASPRDRIDAHEYLKVRLVDLVIGDWDRHQDQSRWGLVERDDVRYWVQIPRDRDYAFANYDGAVMGVLRSTIMPNAVRFSHRIDDLLGLTLNSRPIDRHLLAGVSRAEWDSIAVFVRGSLTDEVIESAVQRVPPELLGRSAWIAARVRSRRDGLLEAADRFYRILSTEVDLRATDASDFAIIDRVADGVVEVRLFDQDPREHPKQQPYLQRRFYSGHTSEVRLHLHGGDDYALVRGTVDRSLVVRVIGGGGSDVMVDSSVVRTGGTHTVFYDSRGNNQFVRGAATAVDREEYRAPGYVSELIGTGYQDWGSVTSFRPAVGYRSVEGVMIGGGPTFTRFGFRKQPYAYRLSATAIVGLSNGKGAFQLAGDFRNTAPRPGGYSFLLSGSQLEAIRFHGLGNETAASESRGFYVVRQERLLARITATRTLPGGLGLAIGPVAKYTLSRAVEESPFDRTGMPDRVGQAGATAEVTYDARDDRVGTRNGFMFQVATAGYPLLTHGSAFAEARATGAGFWTPHFRGAPTLAFRGGGRRLWGDYPVQEAAFLGGAGSVRGFRSGRFAGDAMVFGNAEVRVPLVNAPVVVRGRLGVLGLADAGRVFYAGENSERWHTSFGGGVWFRFHLRAATFATSATYARSTEEGRLYIRMGTPF
jgi:hypothetical protein